MGNTATTTTICIQIDKETVNGLKVLVTGAKGMLGHDVMAELRKRGHDGVGVDIEEMDILQAEAVRQTLLDVRPDAVVHCAAYTAVDAAEDHPQLCRQVNADGTANIARVCGENGIKMLYLSTDYVFDGGGTRPWEADDPIVKPLNVYGQSKYGGEQAVKAYVEKYYIVRTSWVFGVHGKNFVSTMLRLGREGRPISVVDDQIGSPTYTVDLARLLIDMAKTDRYGVYHATNEGFCSWYDFTREIFTMAGINVDLRPVSSEAYPAKAKRPQNSRMSKEKLIQNGLNKLPPWKDAVRRYLEEIQ